MKLIPKVVPATEINPADLRAETALAQPMKRGRGRPPKYPKEGTGSTVHVDTPSTVSGITREEFDALERRMTAIELALARRATLVGEKDLVPGLSVTPVDDPEYPGRCDIELDVEQCAGWTEADMLMAGEALGLDLTVYRGQPRQMRSVLYTELAQHGVKGLE